MWFFRNDRCPLLCPESSTDSSSTTIGPSVSLVGSPNGSQYQNIPTTDQDIRRKVGEAGQLLRSIRFDSETFQVKLPTVLRWRMKDLENQRNHVLKVYADQLKFLPNESPSPNVIQALTTLDVIKQAVEKLYQEMKLSDEWRRQASKCRPAEPDYSTDESSIIGGPPVLNSAVPSRPNVPRGLLQQGPGQYETDSSDTETVVQFPKSSQPFRQEPASQPAGVPERTSWYPFPFARPLPYPAPSAAAASASARNPASVPAQIPSNQVNNRNPLNMVGRIPTNIPQQQQTSNAVYALDTQGRPVNSEVSAAVMRHFIQVPRVVNAPAPPIRPPSTTFQQAQGLGYSMGSSQQRFWNPADYARLPTEYPPLLPTYNPRPFHHARR